MSQLAAAVSIVVLIPVALTSVVYPEGIDTKASTMLQIADHAQPPPTPKVEAVNRGSQWSYTMKLCQGKMVNPPSAEGKPMEPRGKQTPLAIVVKTLLSADRVEKTMGDFDAPFMLKSVQLTAVPSEARKLKPYIMCSRMEHQLHRSIPRLLLCRRFGFRLLHFTYHQMSKTVCLSIWIMMITRSPGLQAIKQTLKGLVILKTSLTAAWVA